MPQPDRAYRPVYSHLRHPAAGDFPKQSKAYRLAGARRAVFVQAIGTSRGGRASKRHGLTDGQGRPRVLLVSACNINDMIMVAALIEAAGRFDRLIADKGYNTNTIGALVKSRGTQVVIPSTASRRAPIPYDRDACRARNLVERRWSGSKTGGACNQIR